MSISLSHRLAFTLAWAVATCVASTAGGAVQFGTWQTGPDMPGSGYLAGPVGAVLDGKFYVVGGRTRATNTGRNVYCYDPGSNAWSTKALLPYTNGTSSHGLVAYSGSLYCFGGTMATDDNWWGQPIVNAYRYDPSSNAWTALPNMSNRRADFTTAVINGRILCFGGSNWWPNATAAVDAYNPSTNTWSTDPADLPVARADGPGGGLYNGAFISVAGLKSATSMNNVTYSYNPTSNAWTQISTCKDTGFGRMLNGFLFSNSDGMYFAGPKTGATNETWISLYHPETGSVEYVAKAPATRQAGVFGYDPASKTIYLGAGAQGSTYIRTLEYVRVLPACTSPSVSLHPHDIPAGVLGQSASFTATAGGTEPLSYQWQRQVGGTWASVTADGNRVTGITGTGTSAVLTFNPVQSSDAGAYRVTFTNTCGSATSDAATLGTVNPPTVQNVMAVQRTDGSRVVDIAYDLVDPDSTIESVSLAVSNNGGSTFAISPSSAALSGDVGAAVAVGPHKRVQWDAGADIPGVYGTNYKVAVTANDGIASRTGYSNAFTIDTRDYAGFRITFLGAAYQGAFAEGIDVINTIIAKVNWNGKTPQKVVFQLNGEDTDVSATGTTVQTTYNMGEDLNYSRSGARNVLLAWAVAADGSASQPARIELWGLAFPNGPSPRKARRAPSIGGLNR